MAFARAILLKDSLVSNSFRRFFCFEVILVKKNCLEVNRKRSKAYCSEKKFHGITYLDLGIGGRCLIGRDSRFYYNLYNKMKNTYLLIGLRYITT